MKQIFMILVCFSLVGCATMINVDQPMERVIEKSRSYDLTYEETWIRAVDWFADHNVIIEKIEKLSGLLTAKYLIKPDDNYFDCGKIYTSGGVSGLLNIEKQGSLNITVRRIDEQTTKVNVNFFSEYKANVRSSWDGHIVTSSGRCVSTGNVEKSILDYIGSIYG